ncbi:MAG: carboxypeptidase regulatory-like domain-containing protein [Zetaproteobacteria bacterium]|nr:MAG: carboxypeptidase regulatory-like domain-containing protein [Zetaproteobacteria bacterium]
MTSAKPGLIRGVVRTAAGRPVAGARVFFRSGPGSLPDIAALTGDDGTFALTAPAAGTYEVAAAADDAVPVSTTVVLTAGEAATVTLRLHA